MNRARCCLCGRHSSLSKVELVTVRPNSRAVGDPRFDLWRCPHCASIHAQKHGDQPSLDARYPDHAAKAEWCRRTLFRGQLAGLRALGLCKTQRILDYGCTDGSFVRYLREQGYGRAAGFDAFNPVFSSRAALDMRQDCIVAQDVLGQVESPHALLAQFSRMLRPKALIMLGTLSAEAIDLGRPDAFAHAFPENQRHILSRRALLAAGIRQGWQLERFYSSLLGPLEAWPACLRLPVSLLFRLFGGAFARGAHGTALFRAP